MTPSRMVVHADGRRFTVDVEETVEGRLAIRVDDVPVEVAGCVSPTGTASLLVDGASHQVDLAEEREGFRIWVDGEPFQVRLEDPGWRRSRAAGRAASAGGQRLTAPMPGKVVAVLVEVGQAVEPGTGLVVLEAMKMENEFRATVAGTVTEVHVAPGQAVNAGDLLIVVA